MTGLDRLVEAVARAISPYAFTPPEERSEGNASDDFYAKVAERARDRARAALQAIADAGFSLTPRDERDVADKSAFAMAAKLASIAAATWVDIYDKAPVGGVLLLCEHVNKAYAAIRSGDVSAMSAAYEALSKDRGVSEHPQQGEG